MRTITLEEHFVTASFIKATEGKGLPQIAALHPKLLDLGAGRIAAMDEAGIDHQVLSLASQGLDDLDSTTATALARDINNELADAARAHPDRFSVFATLDMKNPGAAAKELERSVTKLGFVGTMLDGTTKIPGSTPPSLFLDDARFLPVFEAAAHLGVPVYLHPALPPQAVDEAYYSNLPGILGMVLSIAGWGWHSETALHTLRLIVSGIFDRLPSLQLIIGHMGEGLPYAMARTSGILSRVANLKQPVADYFQSNIHITTSGYFTQPPLKCALDVVGIDRTMFSIDYPFSPNTHGREFLTAAAATLSPEDLAKLSHRNAERVLKLSLRT
jgi:uncharacterized protein